MLQRTQPAGGGGADHDKQQRVEQQVDAQLLVLRFTPGDCGRDIQAGGQPGGRNPQYGKLRMNGATHAEWQDLLGGRSLRGFQFRAVSPLSARAIGSDPPTDTSEYWTTTTGTAEGLPNGDSVGGLFRFFAGAQYEVPIFDKFIAGVVFTDTGTVTDTLEMNPYRASLGCGLRLYIPQLGQAPLAFDFAVPYLKYETDETETFSFTAELPF